MGQTTSIFLLPLLQRMSNPRVSVSICVILLTEKEEISTRTCHILWPVAYWDGRWWQDKQHSFSRHLSDLLREKERAVLTREIHQPRPYKHPGPRQAAPHGELKEQGGRTSKEIPPLCQAPDGRPSHGKTCWRHCADSEWCQGKGPLVGLLLPLPTAENKAEKVARDLKGHVLVQRPYWRALHEASGGVSSLELVLAGFSHTDFECNMTTH